MPTERPVRGRYQTGSLRPGSFSQRFLSLPRLASISLRLYSSTHERRNPMIKLLASLAIAVSILASSTAIAAEKSITLAVKNMYCAACPHTVKASLQAVPGVGCPAHLCAVRLG